MSGLTRVLPRPVGNRARRPFEGGLRCAIVVRAGAASTLARAGQVIARQHFRSIHPPPMPHERTAEQILAVLRAEGARSLRRVVLRENRSTIWSLTQGGAVLNLHSAYRSAPPSILQAFACLVREARGRSPAYREARRTVAEWPGLAAELRRIRRRHGRARVPHRRGPGVGPCCATDAQRVYLRRMYRYLNATRFGGRLPRTVPVRLSNRFSTRLGQMVPGMVDGKRAVLEIALNVDLMLRGNGRQRLDTLLHEMAHAADYLFDGAVGHGESWRRWARRAGCDVRATCDAPIRRRRRGARSVTRVPPLPRGWRARAA